MRPGQNRRMRGRNNNNNNNNGNRKSPNPLQRSYESNGPDVKVRGTAQHVAEKYLQLARDAQSSGDPVAAENYFQHAEHYYRILLAAQEQMTQQFGHTFQLNRAFVEDADELEEEGEEEAAFQGGQPQGERQHNGVNGHGGQRQDGEEGEGGSQNNGQRFDRPPRQERQDRNFDRNGQRRFDRNDRQDRNDRGDRPERGERRFDRNEGQNGSYAPRPEAQPGAEQPDIAPVQGQGQGERRFERPERQERQERPDRPPRGERPSRRDQARASNSSEEQDAPAGLPAFLTTPTRVPIAIAEEAEAPVAAPVAAAPTDAVEAAPEAGEKPKRRAPRRRSPREVMDALGGDGGETPAE